MLLSNRQKQSAVLAAKAAGLGEIQRHMVQAAVLGQESLCGDVSRHDYIRLMAFLEDKAGGRAPGFSPGYWKAERHRSTPSAAILHRIREEARRLSMTDEDVNRFLASDHCSSGRYQRLSDTPLGWLVKCLEALKAMRSRPAFAKATAGEPATAGSPF